LPITVIFASAEQGGYNMIGVFFCYSVFFCLYLKTGSDYYEDLRKGFDLVQETTHSSENTTRVIDREVSIEGGTE